VAFRFDLGQSLSPPQKLANGWLKVDAKLTRTGVFEYRNLDGTVRRELRLPEDVFHPDSLASFSMVPLTDDHPYEGALTADNAKQYTVGHAGESIARNDNFVVGKLLITDAKAISKVEAGKTQISCGYFCDLEPRSGEYEGQKYDGIQRNIRGNHIAIVDVGRAGPEVKIRMDGDSAFMLQNDSLNPNPKGKNMAKIKIDGIDYEVSDMVAQAYEKYAGTVTGKLDSATVEIEKSKARIDSLESELKKEKQLRADAEDPKKRGAVVKERVALETSARKILGSEATLDDKSDREVRIACLLKLDTNFKPDGKSEDYITARFDSALQYAGAEAIAGVREHADNADGNPINADSAEEKARLKMMEGQRNAWKTTTEAKK
jgi:hypothetical protein